MRETVTGWGRFSKSPVQPQPVPELTPRSSLQLVGHGRPREGYEPVFHCPAALSACPCGNRAPICPGPRPICVNTATPNRCPPERQHSSSRLSFSLVVQIASIAADIDYCSPSPGGQRSSHLVLKLTLTCHNMTAP